MRLLHSLAKTHASFDDPNLVSHAGLVPVMALADRAGLADLVAAITGADSGVLTTAASAFRPRTSSDFPWIFVWPNLAPCLPCP